jgi:predicted aspartyl protease
MENDSKYWKLAGKIALFSTIPALVFVAISHRVSAEDPGICYMITASGKTVDLNGLCGVIIPEKKIAQLPVETTTESYTIPHVHSYSRSHSRISRYRVTRIPIKRYIGETPVIEVKFNNKHTFDMILDTGANSTLITRNMAKKLQVKPTGVMEAQVADGTDIRLLTGRVRSIGVKGLVARNLQVAIAPKAGIGLLGHDFFRHYDITISDTQIELRHR